MIIIVFHYYNIYTLLCASTSCLISHDARIIPSSTERSCITIEHSYYKNNSDHLLKTLVSYLVCFYFLINDDFPLFVNLHVLGFRLRLLQAYFAHNLSSLLC